MNNLAPGIELFDNVFPESTLFLEKVYEAGLPWEAAKVGSYDGPVVNTNTRDTDSLLLPDFSDPQNSLIHSFSKSFREAIDQPLRQYFSEYGNVAQTFARTSMLRYGAGQFFTDHIDDSQFNHRRLSMTYYIDEGYEGGEIEFPRFNLRVKAKKHQLLLFPSNYVYNHRVHPVTSGVRHVLVQWVV